MTASMRFTAFDFDASKYHELSMPFFLENIFRGRIDGLWVWAESVTSTEAITMRLSEDSAGDKIIVTDTESTMSKGLTTTTKGSSVWSLSLDIAIPSDKIYLHAKTDAGTITITGVLLTWEE